MTIDELGEFGLIDRIRSLLPNPGSDVVVGVGDDVAVLRASSDRLWLATCDVQVEGSHFIRERIDPRDLGWKALAVNLSDIASAGGLPRFALVSLGLPSGLPVDFVDGLYAGLREEALAFGVEIVGGNISRSRHGLFIDIFLLGEAPRERVMLRSGARPGDCLLVTGALGDAAAGVSLLLSSEHTLAEGYRRRAESRRDRPIPRVREGALIASSGLAGAMIDVSDGLAGDLGHICERSGVSARILAQALPVAAENRLLSQRIEGDEWRLALSGGEDYELLFTAPPGAAERLAERITRETGTAATIIGEILPPGTQPECVLPDGRVAPLSGGGWDHFGKESGRGQP